MTAVVLIVLVAAVLLLQLVDLRPQGRRRRLPTPSMGWLGVRTALAVGAALRLLWVIWATRTPQALSDPAEYLRMAVGFTEGDLPTFASGEPTAFFAPGYPALLTPIVAIARATDVISPAFAASLVNVVGGVVTIALAAFLARRWIAPGAGAPAAWLLALAPAQIFWTATAHTESVFTAVALGVIALCTVVGDRPGTARALTWVGVGALIGFAVLVRSPGMLLLAVPALTIRARSGAWSGAGKVTLAVALGAAVLLVPWTIRNVVQVGVWTPTSTSNATAICAGHHDDARADFRPTRQLSVDCYRSSPYDDAQLGAAPSWWEYGEPDEGRWYREATGRGIRWALGHPGQEVGLVAEKFVAAWGTDTGAVAAGRNFAEGSTWPGRSAFTLGLLANLWLWATELAAIAALVIVPAARRALPIWGPIVLLTLLIVAGLAFPHYRHPAIPLLVILASGVLVRPAPRGP